MLISVMTNSPMYFGINPITLRLNRFLPNTPTPSSLSPDPNAFIELRVLSGATVTTVASVTSGSTWAFATRGHFPVPVPTSNICPSRKPCLVSFAVAKICNDVGSSIQIFNTVAFNNEMVLLVPTATGFGFRLVKWMDKQVITCLFTYYLILIIVEVGVWYFFTN